MKPTRNLAPPAFAITALPCLRAPAAECCNHDGQLAPKTQYPLNGTVEIGASNRFFVVKDQRITGSAAPETYGVK